MVSRSAVFVFLLLLCATARPQASDQGVTTTLKSFHDATLNLTYFYPGRFIPAEPRKLEEGNPASPQCVQSTLSASSTTPGSRSVFVLSTIDNTCPAILRGAIELGPFIREQLLRQLKNYGTPVITQEPSNYFVDGHPAAIGLASAQAAAAANANSIAAPQITYAAKACMLGNIPVKSRRKVSPGDQTKHVLCFDFTTDHRDLLSLMFGFTVNFDGHNTVPLVPGSALR